MNTSPGSARSSVSSAVISLVVLAIAAAGVGPLGEHHLAVAGVDHDRGLRPCRHAAARRAPAGAGCDERAASASGDECGGGASLAQLDLLADDQGLRDRARG